jgi:hypothetical protein
MSSEALRRLVLFHFLLKSWKPQKRTFLRRLKQSSTLRLVTVLLGLPHLVCSTPLTSARKLHFEIMQRAQDVVVT